ncbi:NAD(P)(+) transhydrogenase (Re/Si-specific) subunit alpha [Aristophania vespae]|uniref:proton-translocating NAD(P)(+) transhydrogenase n=1 Tax=Aristophania vespae TaxID=2697033 RepID=A0A6P1NH53_9PROT|nr:NAD(P) transhydrogenase subunit alpha [Aristophania vespae]QHI95860.1 NAD(P)(+) transhydrogenase (Re/Si-specific) subunit alpha [Aristophania vespae]UMM63583.1 NAD(P) transhydrogenase subunit alpha part 1 [Aristophania vespae]
MTIKIAILRETLPDERRVAMIPAVAERLSKLGATLVLEQGAGAAATYTDQAYAKAQLTLEPDQHKLLADADIVLSVQPPPIETVKKMKAGALLVSFIYAQAHPELVKILRDNKITTFAMELVPRISRAQAMDALSSQAALAGYYAPLLGSTYMQKILPMMTTAVGSLRAARVLVMGLGVAGLQALATARRLGAMCEGYDVRPETKEQAESVGAKFVDTGIDARGEGGYARELTAEEKAKVRQVLSQHIAQADMIITTAAIPGRKAPRLIDADQLAAMKEGSVVVDMGAPNGGNCEGSKSGEVVKVGPVILIGPANLSSSLAAQASELYAKNILNLLQQVLKDGVLKPDFADEVIAGTTLTHDGKITNAAIQKTIEGSGEHA